MGAMGGEAEGSGAGAAAACRAGGLDTQAKQPLGEPAGGLGIQKAPSKGTRASWVPSVVLAGAPSRAGHWLGPWAYWRLEEWVRPLSLGARVLPLSRAAVCPLIASQRPNLGGGEGAGLAPLPPPLPARAPQRQAGRGCSQSLTHGGVADTSASSLGREGDRQPGSQDPGESRAGQGWHPSIP